MGEMHILMNDTDLCPGTRSQGTPRQLSGAPLMPTTAAVILAAFALGTFDRKRIRHHRVCRLQLSRSAGEGRQLVELGGVQGDVGRRGVGGDLLSTFGPDDCGGYCRAG